MSIVDLGTPEHFEGQGANWDPFEYFGGEENLFRIMREVYAKGNINNSGTTDDNKVMTICHPADNPIQCCTLIKEAENGREIDSMYLFMEGIPVKLKMLKTYTWENGIEGEVEAGFPGCFDLSFFAPFYYKQFLNVEPNTEQVVFLAGLALYIENDTNRELQIDRGDFYEVALKRFLDDNPGKTKKDFPYATIYMGDSSLLFPTKYYSQWQYRGPILDLKHIELFGEKVIKAKVRIFRTEKEENAILINLYITEKILNGYVPKIGDCISGVMRLTGYLKL